VGGHTRGIDFTKLALVDAIDLAVLIEQEASDRYEELADQMELHHSDRVARFFRHMQEIELAHEARLRERRTRLFGNAPRRVRREMIFDIEAPDYDEVRAGMTARAALCAALRAEQKAFAFFDATIPKVGDAEVRELFTELRAEEAEHQAIVERQIQKLGPDADLSTDEFADEPVAH
jgi:rubrerythrin